MNPPEQNSQQGCSCASILVPFMMILCGIAGQQVGLQWGIWTSVLGAVIGAILGVPVTGLLFLIVLGFAFLTDKVRGSN